MKRLHYCLPHWLYRMRYHTQAIMLEFDRRVDCLDCADIIQTLISARHCYFINI